MSRESKASAAPTLAFGIALGFLSVLGPFAIDLYLPAMPAMASSFAAESGAVQRTLSAFFIGLAIAQIPVGLLGDRFGRRGPLLGGLLLFMATSLACAFAQTIEQLVFLRFLQGMAACVGTSSARAMIRDQHQGHGAARLMAFTFLVIGISPVLAPLAGSFLLEITSWRGLFLMLAGAALVTALMVAMFLPETLPEARRRRQFGQIWVDFGQLLANLPFIGWALVAGCGTTVAFAFVTAAPFIYTRIYELNGHQYSVLLAMNAVASIIVTQFAPGLMRRYGARLLVMMVAIVAGAATVIIAGLAVMDTPPLFLFQLYSMLLFAIAGLMLTPAATSALDTVSSGAGLAAGLLGTLQLMVTGIASASVSLFPSFTLFPLLFVLGTSFLLVLAIMFLLADGPRRG
ncbi:MAG: Bcr/CflA family efflux MFS transporter [Sphingobium sp.]|nr:Bcr/CflA family efflux MFS transporter [Sphingobium sp.]